MTFISGTALYRCYLKRRLDSVLALLIGALICPILIVIALLVYLKLGRPIIFQQTRSGYLGKPFTIYKFRTMTETRDAQGSLASDARRLTSFGVLLRATSLDELPELFNVLKGEMSLVGPRPLLMEYLPRYTPEQMRRHEVKPGITGWAQVNGRNALSWEQKFAMDRWYVDHCSLWLDMKILWLTLIKVFHREGITAEGQVTSTKFMGTQHE